MNADLAKVLGLLGACIVMFAINRPRMDVVALIALLVLPLTGVLTMTETLAGFGDPGIVLIGLLFVIGEGLVRTGVAYRVGDWLAKTARASETRLVVLLMLAVTSIGSVMSSTGVVAIFIPIVLSVAGKMNIAPGRLMMPLSFAALISGMLTLVATAPNLVVDSTLKREGLPGLGFFSVTPIGLVVLALAIGYMLLARRWLTRPAPETADTADRRNFQHFIADYQLASREQRLRLLPGSPWCGQPLRLLGLRERHGANIIAIERPDRFGNELLYPEATTGLQPGDALFIDLENRTPLSPETLASIRAEALPLSGNYFSDQSRQVGMAEVAIRPDSSVAGKTLRDAGFRRRYGLHVIGLRRDRASVLDNILDRPLHVADTLLVAGPWKDIRRLQTRHRDFIVLSLPAEASEAAPAASRAPHALLCLALMIALMISGLVPNVVAALAACLLMGAFRCIDLGSAYKSVHWQILILIAGMIPFATALEKTGGVDIAVNAILGAFGDAGPRVLLASLFGITALTGLFVSNTVTAILIAPVAINLARHLHVSPVPFAITVALAASTAFMTPISSPVNTLVVGPGNYQFSDFLKVGVPFSILVLLVSVALVPLIFPF